MKIYIRFNADGIQTEAIQSRARPSAEWCVAPPDFGWDKRYKRSGDQVVEMTAEDIAAEQLQIQKDLVISNTLQELHGILDQQTHRSLLDSPLRIMEAEAARVFLENNGDAAARAALQPLADLWRLSLEETARKLQAEAAETSRLLLLARTYHEKAVLEITPLASLEALEAYHVGLLRGFTAEVGAILNGGAHA